MEFDRSKRIIDLTLGELEEWFKSMGFTPVSDTKPTQYVYGILGIMNLFNCTESKARQLRNGTIKEACRKDGKTIVVDADKARNLFNLKYQN